jgi:hypothetical protein
MEKGKLRKLRRELRHSINMMRNDGIDVEDQKVFESIIHHFKKEDRNWVRIIVNSILIYDKRKGAKTKPRKTKSLTEDFIKAGAYDAFATKHFAYPKEGEIKHNKRKIIEVKRKNSGKILKADGSVYKKEEENNEGQKSKEE